MTKLNGTAQPRTRRKAEEIDWKRRQQIKARFDALSPEEQELELQKLSSEDLFFLVADTIRADAKQNSQAA